jgi:hypothetical protein
MNNPLVPNDDHSRTQCDADNTKSPKKSFAKTCTEYWLAIQIPGLWQSTMAMNFSSKGLYNACSYTKSTAILCLRYSHWKDTSKDSLTLLIILPHTWIEFSDQRGHSIGDRICCNQEIITKTPTTAVCSSSRITARTCQWGWRCT